jgi:hypothetical protein
VEATTLCAVAVSVTPRRWYLFNYLTGSLLIDQAHPDNNDILALAFNENGSRLAMGAYDNDGAPFIRVLQVNSNSATDLPPVSSPSRHVFGAGFSVDASGSERLVLSGDAGIHTYDPSTGGIPLLSSNLVAAERSSNYIAFFPGPKILVVADDLVQRFFNFGGDQSGPSIVLDSIRVLTYADTSTTLSGTISDASGVSAARYRIDGGVWQTLQLSATGRFMISLTSLSFGLTKIDVDATDTFNNSSVLPIELVRPDDKTPPSISNVTVSPSGGSSGTQFVITAKVTDEGTGIASVTASVAKLDGTILGSVQLLLVDGVFRGVFDSSSMAVGTYTVNVGSTDRAVPANSTVFANAAGLSISPPPVDPTLPIRVDSGNASTYIDSLTSVWNADTGFQNGAIFSSAAAVANTSDPTLYQSQRYAANTALSYRFSTPNGNIRVKLKFAETSCTTANCRIFNIAINGVTKVSNLDLFIAAGGVNRAYDLDFVVNVTSNQVNIDLQYVKGNPIVAAIELDVATTPSTFSLTAPSNGASQTNHVTLQWGASQGATTYDVYLGTVNPPATVVFAGVNGFSQQVSGLDYGTTYFWKVVAKNAAGQTSSTVSSFSTQAVVGRPVYLLRPATQDSTLDYLRSVLVPASVLFADLQASQIPAKNLSNAILIAGFSVTPSDFTGHGAALGQAIQNGAWILAEGYGGYILQYAGLGSVSTSTWSPAALDTFYFIKPIASSPLFDGMANWDPPTTPDKPEQRIAGLMKTGTRGALSYTPAASGMVPTVYDYWALGTTYGWSGQATNTTYCQTWGGCTGERSARQSSLTVYAAGSGKVFYPFSAPHVPGDYELGPVAAALFRNYIQWGRTITPSPVTISGRITASNLALAGVTVNLTGTSSASTSTDTNGQYAFTPLTPGGSYTLTPSKTGCTFTPSSRSFANMVNSQPADFTAVCTGQTLPGAFNLTAPANNATNQATSLTLQWGTSTGATGYDVYHDTANPPATLAFSDVAATSQAISGLKPGWTYYWKIVAKNSAGSTPSTVWSFSVAPPADSTGYLVFKKANNVWSIKTDGSGLTQLTTTGDIVGHPRLSNGVLVYIRNSQLYRAPFAGGTPVAIPNTSNVQEFDIDPTGTKLLITYAGYANGAYNNQVLYTINLDGSGKTAINTLASQHNAVPSFGRNGYIYLDQSNVGNAYTQKVYRIPVGGVNNSIQLVNFFSQFAIQGNNNRVLFYGNTSNTNNPLPLYVMNADGTSQTQIPNATMDSTTAWPAFDYFSDVAYWVQAGTLYRINVNGTGKTALTTGIDSGSGVDFGTAAASGLRFVTVTPCRVVDTRNAAGPFGGPYLAAGSSRSFALPQGACGIPVTAQAYSLNVTVVPRGTLSYLTMWPAGETRPVVSTLNSYTGDIVANAAIVPAGTNGAVSAFVTDDTELIIDINGYFQADTGSTFYAATPCRVTDTRNATGPFGGPVMGAGASRSITVPSGNCSIPTNATAYAMNVTAVPAGSLGYLTTWPTGQTRPVVSTLNSYRGRIVANAAIVPAGSSGAISTFVTDQSHVILDINGHFGPSGGVGSLSFNKVTPCRVVDTRNANGTFGGPLLGGGTSRSFPVPQSSCGIPATAKAYSVNVTVVPTGILEYLTVWPTGSAQPVVSTLNSYDGAVVANAAIVPAGTNGSLSFFVTNNTHLIVDINGYFQ